MNRPPWLSKIRAVFSDLDDTITFEGKLLSSTLQRLEALREKGFWIVIISGRPAGWADCLMRLAPIDDMIFENGAGLMTRHNKKIETVSFIKNASLVLQKQRLQALFDELKKEIPSLKLATDQSFRLCDFAIDYNEEPPFLSEEEREKIMSFLEAQDDITVKLSSIHINYWVGKHTKVTACESLLSREGKNRGISPESVVFCGDSPNDEPLFTFFPYSVGVANIQQFLPRMKSHPTVISPAVGGRGFEKFADLLLSP